MAKKPERVGNLYKKAIGIVLTPGTTVFQFDKEFRFASPLLKRGIPLVITPGELLGKRIDEVLPNYLVERIKAKTAEVIRTTIPQNFDYALRVGGKNIILNASIAPILRPETKQIEYVTTIIDVTEKKGKEEAEETLKEYQLLMESTIDLIFIIDRNNRFLLINKTLAKMFRRPTKELIGKSIFEVFPNKFATEFAKNVREVFRTSKSKIFEQNVNFGKVEIYTTTSLSPLKDTEGNVTSVMGIARDTTKSKQIESILQRNALMIDQSSDAIFSKSLDGTITSWNRSAERMYGYSAKEMIGKSLDILLPFDRKWEMPDILDKIKRRKNISNYETVRLTKKGELVQESLSVSPIVDTDGNIMGASTIARDITERKKEEENLRDREMRYRRLFEAAQDGLLILDADTGKILEVNQFLMDLLGYSRKDFLEKHLWEIGVFKDIAASKAGFLKLKSKDYIRYESMPLETKAGKKIEVEFVSYVYDVGDKKVIQCNIRNITERKKEEENLRDREMRYRRLFEAAQDGLLILDADTGKILEVNQFLMDLLGYSRKDFLEKHLWEIGVFKDIAASKTGFLKLKSKEYIRYEGLPLETKAGKKIEVEFVSYVYDVGDKKVIQCNIRNITERKKSEESLRASEENYRQLFVSSPAGVFHYDNTFHVTGCNDRLAKMLKTTKSRIVGLDLNRLKDKSIVIVLHDALKGNEGNYEGAYYAEEFYRASAPGPKDLWISLFAGPIFDNENKIRGGIGVMNDISERKKSEDTIKEYAFKLESDVNARTEQLTEVVRKVEALSIVKDEFMRNVTHELKTPLSVIIGSIALLKDMVPAGKEKEWMEMLDIQERNAVRLRGDIEQILQPGRLEKVAIRRENVPLDEVLNDVYKEHLPLAEAKGIKLSVDAKPIVIIGDKDLLKLAVNNLVSNAIKFTDKGAVSISAKTTDGRAVISVSDTGKGISPENRKRLFEKFFKVDPSAPGTGVGLAITKQTVDKHGGKINIKSDLGKGSVFEIILPLNPHGEGQQQNTSKTDEEN
jgi:PAS domain S-box-containing protein